SGGVVADELHIDESDVFAIAFERWRQGEPGVEVDSDYCRSAWLPVVGPAAWLLWGTVTRELAERQRVEWSLTEIARFHGIPCAEVTSALEQLARFSIANCGETGV